MFVYLTGGIGTGKSSVLSMFADLGARIVSADLIVHALLRQPELQALVAHTLGMPDASDRTLIAQRVFGDESALRSLEALIHPLVAEEIDELRANLPSDEVLVYEVPLPPTPRQGELVICVEATADVRRQRLIARGMTAEDAVARIAVQPDPAVYREHAAHVITNDADEVALATAVERVWEVLRNGARHL